MTYAEKCRDPRWQRKRLETFQRDDFRCKWCLSRSNTLEVHHVAYIGHHDPWDYPDWMLETLCASCHDSVRDPLSTKSKGRLTHLVGQIVTPAYAATIGCILSNLISIGTPKITIAHAINNALARLIEDVTLDDDAATSLRTREAVQAPFLARYRDDIVRCRENADCQCPECGAAAVRIAHKDYNGTHRRTRWSQYECECGNRWNAIETAPLENADENA